MITLDVRILYDILIENIENEKSHNFFTYMYKCKMYRKCTCPCIFFRVIFIKAFTTLDAMNRPNVFVWIQDNRFYEHSWKEHRRKVKRKVKTRLIQ